ncbi:MAG: hypothetical protein QM579_00875 [Desulfovibrio sp.]|uniref:hypothetical protein n=1 Tax=Desulfovibrio sp. TaxID=885 RepID=UPI0039E42E7F
MKGFLWTTALPSPSKAFSASPALRKPAHHKSALRHLKTYNNAFVIVCFAILRSVDSLFCSTVTAGGSAATILTYYYGMI